jgi:hypothetical protein
MRVPRADASERVRCNERPASRPEGRPGWNGPLSGERGGRLQKVCTQPALAGERGPCYRAESRVEPLVLNRKADRQRTGASPTRAGQLAGSPLPALGGPAA